MNEISVTIPGKPNVRTGGFEPPMLWTWRVSHKGAVSSGDKPSRTFEDAARLANAKLAELKQLEADQRRKLQRAI